MPKCCTLIPAFLPLLLTLSALAAAEPVSDPATDSLAGLVIGRDWPNWRGPFCNGWAGDSGQELHTSLDQAKVAWESEMPFKPAYRYSADHSPTWGFSDYAIVDGKLYYRYTEPSGPISARSRELGAQWLAKVYNNDERAHKKWRPEQLERMADILGQVRGNDVMLCIDIENGRTLWKTNFRELGMSHTHMMIKNYGTQGTPCVAYGKAYMEGAGRVVYAVDQHTGEPIWRSDSNEQPVQLRTHYLVENERGRLLPFRGNSKRNSDGSLASVDACPMPVGGAIALNTFNGAKGDSDMCAVDAATGRPLWQVADCCPGSMNATPLRWRHQGKEYAVSGSTKHTVCVEPLTGKVLWKYEGFANQKAMGAIAGDLLINCGDAWGDGKSRPPHCLEMSLTGAKKVWALEETSKNIRMFRFTSPLVYKNIVYLSGTGVGCHDLKTGKLLGTNAATNGYNPLAADGVIVGDKANSAGGIGPAGTDVDRAMVSTFGRELRPEIDTVQVLVDGRLYIRRTDRTVCVDLRKNPSPTLPIEAYPEVASDVAGLVEQLDHKYLTVRERATQALVAQGAAAAPALAKVLLTGSWYARQAAAEAIRGLGSQAASVAPQLAAALPQAVGEQHWGQVLALLDAVQAADASAFAPIIDGLAAHTRGKVDLVVFRACFALGAIGPTAAPATSALADLVARDDPHLSALAAEALGKIGPAAKAACPILLQAVKSKHGPVVAWSLDALRQIGTPVEASAQLIALMWAPAVGHFNGKSVSIMPEEFKIPLLAWQAGECLKAIGPSVVAPVVASLEGKQADKFAPTMAINVLKTFPDEASAYLETIEAFVGKKNIFDSVCLKIIKKEQ